QKDVISENAIFPNDGMCMREKMVTDPGSRIDHNMRQQSGMISQRDSRSDDCIGSDMGMRSDDRRRVNDRCRMNAGLVDRWLIKRLDRLGEGQVGIRKAQGSCGYFREIRGN